MKLEMPMVSARIEGFPAQDFGLYERLQNQEDVTENKIRG